MVTISRILVPVDFSDWSRAALSYALGIAARFDAAVDVFHVFPLPPPIDPNVVFQTSDGSSLTVPQLMRREAKDDLSEFLRGAVGPDTPAEVEVRGHTKCGEAADEILRRATMGRYGLIVMGTRGRSGLSRVFMGSVAEAVLRQAPCPVMTVRRDHENRSRKASAA